MCCVYVITLWFQAVCAFYMQENSINLFAISFGITRLLTEKSISYAFVKNYFAIHNCFFGTS